MRIDPIWQVIAGAVVLLLTAIAQGVLPLPPEVPASIKTAFVDWDKFLVGAWLIVQPVLAGFTSEKMGPFASPSVTLPPITKAIAFLAMAGLGLMLLSGGMARAAGKGDPLPASGAPLNFPIDPLHLNASKPAADGTKPASADDSIFSRIAGLFQQDFQHAADDAIAEPTVQDGNGYVCWKAWQPLGNIIKRHPTIVSGQIADDVEGARLVIAAFGQICKVNECQIVASDAAAVAAKAVTALPISINLPAPINIFAKTCNDIPNISLVAPPAGAAVSTPVPTPTPTGN